MNKEIRAEVQRLSHLDKSTCSLLLSGLERVFQEEVIHMTSIDIAGLGVFVPHKHPEYLQDDPASSQVLLYPPRITCRFAAASTVDGAGSVLGAEISVADTPRINTQHFASLLADYVKLEPAQAFAFVQALVQVTVTRLQAGEEVTWTGFGTFRVVNFRDGANSRVAWIIDDKMREQINAPFGCFEPVAVGKMEVADVPDGSESLEQSESSKQSENLVQSEQSQQPEESEPSEQLEHPEPSELSVPSEPEELVQPESTELSELSEASDPEEPEQPESTELPESEPQSDPAEQSESTADAEPVAVDPSEQPSIPLIFGEESRRRERKNVSKSNNSARKWIFGAVILLFLIFICNICARLIWPSSTKLTPPPAVMDEVETVFNSGASVATEPDDNVETDSVTMEKSDAEAQSDAEDSEESAPQSAESALIMSEPSEPAQVAEAAATQAHGSVTSAQSSMYMVDDDGLRKTARVQAGDRLTLMAHRYYGHKAFWVYIYEVNKDKLASPDNVTAGMELYLPDPVYWQIDADSETSIQTALRRASKLVK